MAKKRNLVESINHCLNIFNIDSLDRQIYTENGEKVTLGETILQDKDTNFLRLKVLLMSLTDDTQQYKGKSERQVIELLIDGYSPKDIVTELDLPKQYFSLIVSRFRKKIEKKKLKEFFLRGQYK